MCRENVEKCRMEGNIVGGKRQTCRMIFFFFQAEGGIRDGRVTGVQTCALPIFYLQKGYIPFDVSDRGAAVTLEYAIDDAAVAALAARYGTKQQVAEFTARAESWRNLLAPDDHFLRPRMSDGSWATPTSLGATNVWNPIFSDGWQEGTGWQYLWLVPQDVLGLRNALGADVMTQRLDEFFAAPAQSEAAPVVPLAQTQASFFGVYYVGNQYTPA